jgi:hypothetical protein
VSRVRSGSTALCFGRYLVGGIWSQRAPDARQRRVDHRDVQDDECLRDERQGEHGPRPTRLQYDFGAGPRIDGSATTLFCAWLARSRFRVVLALRDKTAPSVFAALDVTLRRLWRADLCAHRKCSAEHFR